MVCGLLLLVAGASARDDGADGRFSQRRSAHFILFQDVDLDRTSGPRGSRQFELDVLAILEDAHDRVDAVLGVRPHAPVRAVVYDAGVFDRDFAALFRFRAAGFFDGALHIRSGTRVDGGLVRTLHHEYVHAALDRMAPPGTFPGWLNEGLAEWFERRAVGIRYPSPGEHAYLRRAVAAGQWIPLAALSGPSFSGLGAQQAAVAYLQAYAVVEHLARRHGEPRLAKLCENLARSRSLSRALRRVLRTDLEKLEKAVLAELS